MKKILVRLLCCFIPGANNRHKVRARLLPQKQHHEITWMGKHSYVGGNFIKMHPDSTIGNFCSIGQNVALGPSQHPYNWLSTSPFQYIDSKKITPRQKQLRYSFEPTTVGNDVWIGNNVIVKDGVHIANGCVIGSNAVVTHDVPPYAIVAGVPARIIKYRFSPEIITKLEELKWWNLPDKQIATLPFNDIKKCIKILEKIRKSKK